MNAVSIEKLALVNIVGEMDSLDDAILRCLEREDFHPERSLDYSGQIRGFAPLNAENPYAELLSSLTDLGMQAGFSPLERPRTKPAGGGKLRGRRKYCMDFCRSFQKELGLLREQKNYLQSEIEQDEAALSQLSHINSLDVDVDSLFSCQYLKVRVGRLPVDSYDKLGLYGDKMFFFVPFDREKNYYWGMVFTLDEYASEIDDLLSSFYFERVRVPDFVHGTPEEALEELKTELKNNQDKLTVVKRELDELLAQKRAPYYEVYDIVRFLSESYEIRGYVSALRRDFLDFFHMTGFVRAKTVEDFAASLREIPGVEVEVLPAGSDKRIKEPTKLKNGWFAKPFEMFVEMYGLPSYNDIDPTPYVAFTYCLLFGIMFGDLGQGLLLVLFGALLWKWKRMNIGRVINRVGIFSCVFGAVYGSVFGFEHLLDPVYRMLGFPEKPVEVMAPELTNVILGGAVALGVALILVSMSFNILLAFRKRDLGKAVFSSNGLCGLLFYGAVLVGAVSTLLLGKNLFTPVYVMVLIILPLLAILFEHPLGKMASGIPPRDAKPENMGSYVMEGFFELIEVVLSFFSNTMSFLRVGGFVLSHAGMMAVVFALSDMVGGGASPVVIVVGNLFVMGMEGLIVGIQVLRLEFYEMFSRYYEGDGKPFVSIGAVRSV